MTTTKTRSRKPATEAEKAARDEKLTAVLEQLDTAVNEIRTGDDWTAWIKFAARFHRYSFGNVLLILAQNPEASHVAGYRKWQELGRQVRKGERGIQILAPVVRKFDETPDGVKLDEPQRRVCGFRVEHVWDVSQTDGDDLPTPPRPRLLEGQAPAGLWDALADQVTAAGYELKRGDCNGANGVTDHAEHTVTVRADVDDAQAVKTLAHELAHATLHTPAKLKDRKADGHDLHRGDLEVEAESVALLVCDAHGLDTTGYSFGYVAGWAKDADAVKTAGQHVMSCAKAILESIPDAALELAD